MNEKELNGDIENLITKFLTGEITKPEQTELDRWISESPSNEDFFQKMNKSYDLAGRVSTVHNDLGIDINAEWNRFQHEVAKRDGKAATDQGRFFTTWRIAAVMLLVITSGLIVNYFSRQNQDFEFHADALPSVVALPDGSVVSLNRNSSLTYTRSFGDEERKVSLMGEAFFEVTDDERKPFIVAVNGAEVTVLGTKFNVRNHPDGVEVMVQTGLVKLSDESNTQSVHLEPGERGTYAKNTETIVKNTNDDINYLAWKTRKIVFESTRLKEVVDVIGKVYGVNLIISTNISPDCEVTVLFDNQSLDAVLAVLKSTLNLTYKKNDDKIEIIKAGC